MRNHNKFCLVNGSILKEISRKKQMLQDNPCFQFAVSNKRKRNLQRESAKHSVSIEVIGNYGNSPTGRSAKAKEIKRCERNLYRALEWGLKNYGDSLTIDYIEKLGEIVEPEPEENRKGFRIGDEEVKIFGSRVIPPSPRKIRYELDTFLLNNNYFDNSLEKSLHAHFHVARIHPFLDGNGRTSRLIQNIILDKGGFLPLTIKMSDRMEYMHLINKAIESRDIAKSEYKKEQNPHYFECKKKFLEKSGLTENEKKYYCSLMAKSFKYLLTTEVYEFYNFLALKERDSLQTEMDRIYKLKQKRS